MKLEQRIQRFMLKEGTFNRTEALFLVYAGIGLGIAASVLSLTLGLAILVFAGLGFWFLRDMISLRGGWQEHKPLTTKQVMKIAKENPPPSQEEDSDPEEAPMKKPASSPEFGRI